MVAFALKRDQAYMDARVNGAQAKLVLMIVDDVGVPISGADIDVFMGMNFNANGYHLKGGSDSNGVFVAEGKTCGNEINVNVAKAGFYGSHKTFRFAEMGSEHEVIDGKWQPYGQVEPIVLRDIRCPIKMPGELFWKFKYTKSINKWIGYDIEENDFVAPDGGGKVADFDVYIDWDGEWLPKYKGMSVRVRFSEPFCGYYEQRINETSDFKYPYEALPDLIDGTEAVFFERISDGGLREQKNFDKMKCWVVRSRCKVSDDGRLLQANYAVIHDIVFTCKSGGYGGFCITGAFNPTPNDRNLEWDMKNNLCEKPLRLDYEPINVRHREP